jgi:hypothetical protein
VEGRTLARNGAVTLDTNTVTRPSCSPATTGATPTAGTTGGTGGTAGGTGGTTGPGGAGATRSGASGPGRLPVTGAPGWTGFAVVVGAALILAGAFFVFSTAPSRSGPRRP